MNRLGISIGLAFVAAALTSGPTIAASGGSSVSTLSVQELSQFAHTTDGIRFYTGDIIIYRRDVSILGAAGGPLWTGGRLYYQFSGQTPTQQAIFVAACNAWSVGTPVVCAPRTNEPNYLLVETHNGEGCGGNAANVSCSAVGMVTGQQELQVYSGHWDNSLIWVIEHEIGHAFGLIHEQSRSDRDAFVTINSANISAGAAHNFDIDPSSRNASDYDYKSIMHYNNCEFSTNPGQCRSNDRSTEAYWTISPIPCGLDEVGGQAISNLDLESINKLYGAAVYSLYNQHRAAQCGSHDYSAAQVAQTCGSNCAAATPIQWRRIYTDYDWGCGFMTILDGPSFCAARKQEFQDQHYDHTSFALKCWGGTLTERYTSCGCSAQHVNAQCADFAAGVDGNRLQKLLNSNDPRSRNAAHFIKTMLHLRDSHYLAPSLEQSLPQVFLAAYVKGNDVSLTGVLCELVVRLTIGRLVNRSYVIDRQRLSDVASHYGFSL